MRIQTSMSDSTNDKRKNNAVVYPAEARWRYFAAELRHCHLLMRPISFILLLVVCCYWIVSTLLGLPSILLGFLLSPILRRAYLFIEFLYPTGLARKGHLFLIRFAQKSWKKNQAGDNNGRKNKRNSSNQNDSTDQRFHDSDKNRGYHSRTIEQRVEVITGRVFIHPLAQLLDNLGYLVVCCPESTSSQRSSSNNYQSTAARRQIPIVAFVVDCGNADEVMEQVRMISRVHYNNQPIQIQAILSTHKHHDHTAGNVDLIRLNKRQTPTNNNATKDQKSNNKNKAKQTKNNDSTIKFVFGGAVENVPCCNVKLADGDKLDLPRCGSNKMSDFIQVEAFVMPAHTRGSVVYALRTKADQGAATTTLPVVFLFTGDTLFSGGAGVPFEAGTDPQQDKLIYNNTKKHSKINTELGNHAVERCFAEILSRGLPTMSDSSIESSSDQFILFPGHEYTAELLGRQLAKETLDLHRWHNMPPSKFFETVSNLYVSLHRRQLPYGSGRLLAVPSTMRRELNINPHLRSLTKRGEYVVAALKLWNEYFSAEASSSKNRRSKNSAHFERERMDPTSLNLAGSLSSEAPLLSQATSIRTQPKTPSTTSSWNTGAADIGSSVFTTVYTSDLERIIDQLDSGIIGPEFAASKLRSMKTKLEMPTIRRRPIPGTLPSQKNIYKGLIGLALMGSRPSALTLGDSKKLNLPPPVIANSDHVLISKTRLITVMAQLGLLSEISPEHSNNGNHLIQIINQLWREAHDYRLHQQKLAESKSQPNTPKKHLDKPIQSYDSVDLESPSGARFNNKKQHPSDYDRIELGILKWMLYGLASKTKQSAASTSTYTFCMPCSTSSSTSLSSEEAGFSDVHPSQTLKIRQQHGELVRHDILNCEICRNFVGYGDEVNDDDEYEVDEEDDEEDAIEIERGLDDFPQCDIGNDDEDDPAVLGVEVDLSYTESYRPGHTTTASYKEDEGDNNDTFNPNSTTNDRSRQNIPSLLQASYY